MAKRDPADKDRLLAQAQLLRSRGNHLRRRIYGDSAGEMVMITKSRNATFKALEAQVSFFELDLKLLGKLMRSNIEKERAIEETLDKLEDAHPKKTREQLERDLRRDLEKAGEARLKAAQRGGR
jgi:hypothetical protein